MPSRKRRVQGQDMRQDTKYGYQTGFAIAPDGEPYYGYHPETHNPICAGGNAHPNKLGDKVCLRAPLKGRLRCKRHRGDAPSGADHPGYEHGERIQNRYRDIGALGTLIESQLEDPDFLSSTAEIGAFRSRLQELMQEIDKIRGEDLSLAPRLARRAYNMLQQSLATGNSDGFQQGMSLLAEALHKDEAVRERWDEMRDTASTIKMFVAQEMTLEKIDQRYISNTDFTLLMNHIQNSILALGLSDEQKARFRRDMSEVLMHQRLMTGPQQVAQELED